MNVLSKLEVHVRDIKNSRSLRFAFYRFLHIINRRLSLPNHIFLGEMDLSDEIIFEDLLNPSEDLVVIDIGANFGLWTLRYSRNYKEVHAFEPNPYTFSVLKRNTRRCKNVKLHCCGLGDREGVADFFVHTRPGRDGFLKKRYDHKRTIRVPIKLLDDFNFDADLIKIDTEGYELPILMGAKKTLERKKPQLYIEIHEKEQEKPIFKLLQEIGYKYSAFKIRNDAQIMIITDYTSAGM